MLVAEPDFSEKNSKKIHGVKRNSPQKFQVVHFIIPIYPENFMKIHLCVFPQSC